ncbi:MAG TPA: FtsW/RodA/SpoVE family cell cycle protein, partial [Acidimicrobiales bacterium]
MSTTADETQLFPAADDAPASRFPALASLREALDKPLTSYYLLLGASALLLTIGLIMVLSASSVYSYRLNDGDSYAVVRRQLMWLLIGLPAAFIASRLPVTFLRRISVWAYVASLLLLFLTIFLGKEINGNRNWLGVGPLVIQPAELAKLALILWAATVYANKERRLGNLHQLVVPVVPGMFLATGLVVAGRDLGTALVFGAILMGMLWVVGAPARLFVVALTTVGVLALWLATTSEERLERLTNFADPFKDYQGAGWQPAHGLFAMS